MTRREAEQQVIGCALTWWQNQSVETEAVLLCACAAYAKLENLVPPKADEEKK